MLNRKKRITDHRITCYIIYVYIKNMPLCHPRRPPKEAVLQLCIGFFCNMGLDSVKGQFPRTPTFPHFLHKLPPAGAQGGKTGLGGKKDQKYSLR